MGKKVIPEDHIKRPMNAFMAWSKKERRKMVEEGTNLNNSVMSRILGEKWKQLNEDEKKTWKKTADRLKREHAKVKTYMGKFIYRARQLWGFGGGQTAKRMSRFLSYPTNLELKYQRQEVNHVVTT